MAASHHICASNKSKDGAAREGVFSRTVKFHRCHVVELIVAANACWQVMQAREDRPATVAAAPVWPGRDVGSAASAPQTAVFCCSRCAALQPLPAASLSLCLQERESAGHSWHNTCQPTSNLKLPPDNSCCLLSDTKCKLGHKFFAIARSGRAAI